MISLTQVLLLVTWLGIGGLIFVLALIARFYQLTSGQSTYYSFYTLPALLFSLAGARYISLNQWGGDVWGDAALFVGGVILIFLCMELYEHMTQRRR